jgi:hypothetical protein
VARQTKPPQEKKRLSLKKDHRNTYGENDKSSRKNIPRSKAMSHRAVRHKASTLERTWVQLGEQRAETAELGAVTPREQKGTFRKSPDTPLGEVIQGKLYRRRRI